MDAKEFTLTEDNKNKVINAFNELIVGSKILLKNTTLDSVSKSTIESSVEAAIIIKQELEELNSSENIVVKDLGELAVIQLFANEVVDEEDADNRFYGDIYSKPSEVYKDHKEATLLVGYGVLDKSTGYLHDNTEDWYDTLPEALEAIKELTESAGE